MPKRSHESEGKYGDDRDDGLVCLDAQNWIARTNDSRPQQSPRHGKKRGIRRNELVFARQADDLINRRLILPFTFDLLQQSVYASPRPESGQLGMVEGLLREACPARNLHRGPVPYAMHDEGYVLLGLLILSNPRGE